MFNDLFGKQPLIVSLDIDAHVEQKIEQLIQSGLNVIELLQCNISLIKHIRSKYPQLKIGLGNIHNVEQLTLAYDLGLDFMSSPGFYLPLAMTANQYQMNYLPGLSTVSDAMTIINHHIYQARPCPGSIELCNQLNKYFPELKLYPLDVKWEDIELFLDLPTVGAVGLSNPDHLQMLQIAESIQI